MKIYDYAIQDVIEISDAQYDFMQVLIKHGGCITEALKDYPVSAEQMESWKSDKIFWPCMEGQLTMLIRAKGLSSDYVKDYLLSTLTGKLEPTDVQMKAINASVRALGMGLQQRTGFNGAITVSPNNTTVTFNDGLDKPTNG